MAVETACQSGTVAAHYVRRGWMRRLRWEAKCAVCGYVWTLDKQTNDEDIRQLIMSVSFFGHDGDGHVLSPEASQ